MRRMDEMDRSKIMDTESLISFSDTNYDRNKENRDEFVKKAVKSSHSYKLCENMKKYISARDERNRVFLSIKVVCNGQGNEEYWTIPASFWGKIKFLFYC